MTAPKISVIVPVYNVEQYLPRCIDSILAQTFTDFELLLIDDGSPDNSGKICDEYAERDTRIRVLHKKNGGVSSARNMGIKESQGIHILFVDSDDYIGINYIQSFYERCNNDDDFVIQGCTCINNDTISYYKYVDKIYVNEIQQFMEEEEMYKHGSPYGKLYLNKIIKTNGLFFNERLHNYEDFIFFVEYIQHVDTVKLISSTEYYYILNNNAGLHNRFHDYIDEKYLLDVYLGKTGKYCSEKITSYSLFLFFRVLKALYISPVVNKRSLIKELVKQYSKIIFSLPMGEINTLQIIILYLLKFRCYNIVDILLKLRYK